MDVSRNERALFIHHASTAEVLPVQAFLFSPTNLRTPKGGMIIQSLCSRALWIMILSAGGTVCLISEEWDKKYKYFALATG